LSRLVLRLGSFPEKSAGSNNESAIKDLLSAIREHLERATAVVSYVELTRLGRVSNGKPKGKAIDAGRGGIGKHPKTLG